MKVVVTGGAGFIGSHLIDSLLEDGHEVVCVDNFYTGRKENIEHHFNNPKFHLIEHDVVNPLPQSLVEDNINQVFHLACPASPVHYQADPVKTLLTSVLGTLHVLNAFCRDKERNQLASAVKVLLSSTSEVYGDPEVHPQSEEYKGSVSCTGPRACYDEGKRAAETLCFDFMRTYGAVIRVARIFNTYGPRMQFDDGRIISNFVHQALVGNPITIYGTGAQTRSFCFVSDLVQGLRKLMDGSDAGPINLGNPEEHSVSEMATKIWEMVTKSSGKSEIQYLPATLDDPARRKPDISKAKRLLNWSPAVALDDGLKQTEDEFRARLRKIRPN